MALALTSGSRSCCEMHGLPWSHCSSCEILCALTGLFCRLWTHASVKKAMTLQSLVRKVLGSATLGGQSSALLFQRSGAAQRRHKTVDRKAVIWHSRHLRRSVARGLQRIERPRGVMALALYCVSSAGSPDCKAAVRCRGCPGFTAPVHSQDGFFAGSASAKASVKKALT